MFITRGTGFLDKIVSSNAVNLVQVSSKCSDCLLKLPVKPLHEKFGIQQAGCGCSFGHVDNFRVCHNETPDVSRQSYVGRGSPTQAANSW
jgi:hypothetical protein